MGLLSWFLLVGNLMVSELATYLTVKTCQTYQWVENNFLLDEV
jgi:hypothetical protein